MKNMGSNGNGVAEVTPGVTAAALMSQLGSLGTAAVAPLGSFGNVTSLSDLATFLPVGTALPLGTTLISVDGSQVLPNVAFTVR